MKRAARRRKLPLFLCAAALLPLLLFCLHPAPRVHSPARRTEVTYNAQALAEAAERLSGGRISITEAAIRRSGELRFSFSGDLSALSGAELANLFPSSLRGTVSHGSLRVTLCMEGGALSVTGARARRLIFFRSLPETAQEELAGLLADFFSALAAESDFVPRTISFERDALTLSG